MAGKNTPPPGEVLKFNNTLAINKSNDFVMLCENNELWIGKFEGDISISETRLTSLSEKIQLDFGGISGKPDIKSISFSGDGSTILLCGSNYLGLIAFPQITEHSIVENGRFATLRGVTYEKADKFSVKKAKLVPEHLMGSAIKITKAMWHSHSSFHVAVLIGNNFLVINTALQSQRDKDFHYGELFEKGPYSIIQRFFLNSPKELPRTPFISFTFGANLSWMRYAVFFISTFEKQSPEIFMLCPVLPHGALIERDSVRNLWQWADDQVATSSSKSKLFIDNLRAFLIYSFGPKDQACASGSTRFCAALLCSALLCSALLCSALVCLLVVRCLLVVLKWRFSTELLLS